MNNVAKSFIIQDFKATFTGDIRKIFAYGKSKEPLDNLETKKVKLAAMRIFATILMAATSAYALYNLTFIASAPVGVILRGAMTVAVFVWAHTLFLYSKNFSDKVELSTDKGLLKDIEDADKCSFKESIFLENTIIRAIHQAVTGR